jgi:Fe2+ or Zn2+ uptake regulation protein
VYDGYIKLHRKAALNEVWRHDRTAWHVFEALLFLADYNSGIWSGGRLVLSEVVNINPNTCYSALKRLEKRNMIKSFSNNRFTTYHICNWSEYNDTVNNQSTTSQQPGNTIKRNKEIKKVREIDEIQNLINQQEPKLAEALTEFYKFRKTLNKTKGKFSTQALKIMLTKLNKMYPDEIDMQIESINESIVNGWAGVFEVKRRTNNQQESLVKQMLEKERNAQANT